MTNTNRTVTIERAVATLHKLTDKEPFRPVLQSIYHKYGKFTAANGFIAATIEHDAAKRGALPEGFHIPRDTAAKIKATERKPGITATIDDATNAATIEAEAMPGVTVAAPEPYGDNTTLPDLTGIFHKPEEIPAAVTLVNAEWLSELANFLKAATGKGSTGMIELRVFGPNTLIEFRARTEEGTPIRAALMPMVNGNEWLFDPVTDVPTPSQCYTTPRLATRAAD